MGFTGQRVAEALQRGVGGMGDALLREIYRTQEQKNKDRSFDLDEQQVTGTLDLGNRRLDQEGDQFTQNLDWKKDSFGQEMDWQKESFNEGLAENLRDRTWRSGENQADRGVTTRGQDLQRAIAELNERGANTRHAAGIESSERIADVRTGPPTREDFLTKFGGSSLQPRAGFDGTFQYPNPDSVFSAGDRFYDQVYGQGETSGAQEAISQQEYDALLDRGFTPEQIRSRYRVQ